MAVRDYERQAGAVLPPSVRTYRTWTPAQLRSAETNADGGYLRGAVDLSDWILSDEKVKSALAARINSVLAAPVSFEKSGDKRRSSRVQKALEAGEDWWAIVRQSESRQILAWAIVLGGCPAWNAWQRLPEHDDRDIPVLRFFHPQPLRYDWLKRAWFRQLERGGEEELRFGDGLWVLHAPDGSYRFWANGLWRGLARWCLLKSFAISDYGRLGEAAVKNVVELDKELEVGANAQGDNRQKRQQLAEDLAAMGKDGAVVLPPGYHYKLVEASAATKDIFDRQIELADEAIAIAIRGGNLTTNVQEGSRAAAQVQERTGDDANRVADASAWVDTTHDQILEFWALSNFGDRALAPWPDFAVQKPEDKQAKATTFQVAIEAAQGAVDLGFKLDQKLFATEFGLDKFLKPGELQKSPEPVPPAAPAPTEGEGSGDPKPPPSEEQAQPDE